MTQHRPKIQKAAPRRSIYHLVARALFLLFLPVIIISLISPMAVRADHVYPNATPTRNAKAIQATIFLGNCIDDFGLPKSATTDDVNEGNVFSGGEGNVKGAGHLLDPSDGRLNCHSASDIDIATKAIGYDSPGDMFKELGIYKGSTRDFVLDMEKGEAIEAIRSHVSSTYHVSFGHISRSDDNNRAMIYAIAYAAFEEGCGPRWDESGGNTIVTYNGTPGTTEVRKFFYGDRQPDDKVTVGYAMGSSGLSPDSDMRVRCNQLVGVISENANVYSDVMKAIQDAGGDISDGVGSSTSVPPSCESDGGSMSWLLCSVLQYADEVVQGLDGALNSILLVPDELTDNPNLKQAWSRLRNLAYFILVPIVLVMVVATAMGFDFVSAYTVKRAMPRLVIAAIFIALSYDIAGFLVKMTNAVGTGLYGLITSAFVGSEAITLSSIFAPANGQGALGLGLAAGVGIAGLAVGSIGIILSYMLVAVASLAIGFFLLSLRQVMIVALMIMAPVAILAWIFPGNDRLWKLWWNTFSKLLLLFPLVMIVVASGRSFAYVIHAVSAEDLTWVPMIHTLMKLVAYVGPFFFIPALFKFAGGVFATVAGMANDRSRGLFDRSRKYRGQKMQKNWGDFKAGQRKFRPKSFNRLGERVGVGAQGGFGFGERGKAALDTTRQARAEQAVRDNPQFQKFLQSDDDGSAVLGLSGSGTRREIDAAKADLRNHWVGEERRKALEAGETWDDAREMRAQAAASVRADQAEARARAIGFNRTNAEAAYYGMAQNKARALEGEDAMDVIARGAERLGGGNERHAESARQGFMFHARGNGRADIGGNDFDDAWSRQSIGAIVGGDARAMRNFQRQIHSDWNSTDPTRKLAAAQKIAELQGALPGATDANAQIINDILTNTVGYDTSKDIGLEDQMAEKINESLGIQTIQTPREITRPHSNPVREARGETETVTVMDTQRVGRNGRVVGDDEGVTGEQIAKSARKYSKDVTEAERLRYGQESLARRASMGEDNPFGGP